MFFVLAVLLMPSLVVTAGLVKLWFCSGVRRPACYSMASRPSISFR